jgi:hypothetical protein
MLTPAQARALRLKRYQRILAAIERWDAKQRRARNALRKLNKQRAYYMRMLTADKPEPTAEQAEHRRANTKAVRHARATANQLAVVRTVLAKACKTQGAAHGQARLIDALMKAKQPPKGKR